MGVSLDGVFVCLYNYAVPVCNPGLTPQRLESFLIENRLRQILCIIIVALASETMEGGTVFMYLCICVSSLSGTVALLHLDPDN